MRSLHASWLTISGSLLLAAASLTASEFPAITDGTLGVTGTVWTARDSSRVWQGIACSDNGTNLVAGVDVGNLYTSSDRGRTWTARANSQRWYGVASSSDGTKLVAVAYGGQIYTSSDSGVSWTARESNRFWRSVASSSDGTKLIAVVSNGYAYTSTDSGANWTQQGPSLYWLGVASSSDGSKLSAIGYDNATSTTSVYTSTDGGANWTARLPASITWSGIASSADGSRLVAVEGGYGRIHTSADSGVSWTAHESNRDWSSVCSSSDGMVLTAVENGGQVYRSTDGGANWTAYGSSRGWMDVASSSDGALVFGTVNNGQIYTSEPPRSIAVSMSEDGSPTPFALTLHATDADSPTLTWSIASAAGAGSAAVSGVPTGASQAISYTPTANVSGSDSFVVAVSDGALSDSITVQVTVAAVNDAPVLAGAGTATFIEDGPAVAIAAALTVGDVDSATLASGGVAITGGFISGEDVLAFANDGSTMGDITGSYDADTGELALTSAGGATKAQWQAALRAVTYRDTSDAPVTTTRTIAFVVNDEAAASATVSANVTVVASNDAPVITEGASVDVAMSEDGTPTVFALTLHATDADSGTLTWSIGTAAGHGTAAVSGTPTGASQAISYAPEADRTGSDSFVVTVSDGTITDTIVVQVTIAGVNDAPELGGAGTVSFIENGPPVAVADALTVADVDSSILVGGGVVISGGFVASEDELGFVNDGSTMGDIAGSYDASSGELALVSAGGATRAQWQAALRAVTYRDTSDAPTTSARTIGFWIDDGSAISATSVATVNLTIANDAPVLTLPAEQSTTTDQAIVLSVAGGNPIILADADAGSAPLHLTLIAFQGRITLATTAGLVIASGDGTGDRSLICTGTLAALNAALDGLTVTPATGFAGDVELEAMIDDLGNTGGGSLSATGSLFIAVSPDGDAGTGGGTTTIIEKESDSSGCGQGAGSLVGLLCVLMLGLRLRQGGHRRAE